MSTISPALYSSFVGDALGHPKILVKCETLLRLWDRDLHNR